MIDLVLSMSDFKPHWHYRQTQVDVSDNET